MKAKNGVWLIFFFSLFFIYLTSCTPKKHLITIEEQKAKIEAANNRIATLEKEKAELDKLLRETQRGLEETRAERVRLKEEVDSLNSKVAGLEKEKADLLATSKSSEEAATKRLRSLNIQLQNIRKQIREKEAELETKEAEITALQAKEATLSKADEENKARIASLNTDMQNLSTKMDKTIAAKNRLIIILIVLLAGALILAVFGLVRKRSQSSV